MPSYTKVNGGYKVYNKETGKSKFVKLKKDADALVAKGYKTYLKKKSSKVSTDKVAFDYGGQLFKASNWVN